MSMLYHGISVIVAFKNGEIKEHCTDFCNEIRVDLCEKKELFKSVSDWDGFSDEVFSAFHTPYDDIGDASWDEYAAIPLEDFVYEISSEDVKNIYSVVLITNHDNDWGPRKLDWKKITLNPYAISTGSYELEADVDLDGCEMRYALEKIIPEVKSFKKSKPKAKKSRNGELSDGVFTYFLYDENSKRCQSLASVDYWVDNDDVCITGYLGEDSYVEIPEFIDGKPVTIICKMSGGKNLKSIHFKNSENKMYVEPDAFKDCEYIEEMIIDVPEKINFIDGALSRCEKLISDGFVIIDGFLFDDIEKNKRKVLEIPEGVKKIGYGIYNQCKNIEEIVLPTSLISVGGFEFNNCSSLKKITVNGKTRIDSYAFLNCSNLEELVVNGEVYFDFETDQKTFSDSPKLTNKGNLWIIGNALMNYSGEEEVCTIPDGVEIIGPSSFEGNRKLKTVKLPDSVKRICRRAFDGCSSLEEINFPEGLVSIGNNAFYGCGLKKVVFNKNLERIGRSAFEYCHNLSEVNISPATVCESEAFNGCNTKELSREDGLVVINGVAYNYYYSKNAKFYNTPDDISRVVLSGDVEAITGYFFNSPGDTLDEFVITNAIKKIPTGAFFLSGIKCLKILDSVSGELIFETSAFKGRSYDLLEGSNKFARFCELVEAGDYETIKSEFSSKKVAKKKTSKTSSKNKEPVSIEVEAKPIIQKVDSLPVDESLDFTDEQICAEWLEKYGEYLAKNPKLEIKDKTFVFSGIGPLPIFDMDMEDSTISLVIKFGGFCRSKISGKTDYLIVNPVFAGESKVKAAIEQLNKGNKIQIVLLDEMQDFLVAKLKNNSADSTPPKKSATTSKRATAKNNTSASVATKKTVKTKVEHAKTEENKDVSSINVDAFGFKTAVVVPDKKKILSKKTGKKDDCDIRIFKMSEIDDKEILKVARAWVEYCNDNDEGKVEILKLAVRKFAKAFRNENDGFDPLFDAESAIYSGIIKKVFSWHALKSFLWTGKAYADSKGKKISELSFEEIEALCIFIEEKGGANYDTSAGDWMSSLIIDEEYDVAFSGASDCILRTINYGVSDLTAKRNLPVKNLNFLRSNLKDSLSVMERLYEGIFLTKEISNSVATEVLLMWSALAYACEEAFVIVKGPKSHKYEKVDEDKTLAKEMLELTTDENGIARCGNWIFHIPDSINEIVLDGQKDFIATNNCAFEDGGYKSVYPTDHLRKIVVNNSPEIFDAENFIGKNGTLKEVFLCSGAKKIKGFNCNNSIKILHLCAGIETLELSVFKGCSKLEEIMLPETLVSIGDYAFKDCKSLKQISVNEGVTKIGAFAFEDCVSLEQVDFPESLHTIKESAFRRCKKLESIRLPKNANTLGYSIFMDCEKLREAIVSAEVSKIPFNLFGGCESLERIVFPSSLKDFSIGDFMNLTSLTSITVPEGVESVDLICYNDRYSPIKIALPESVSEMSEYAADRYRDKLSSVKFVVYKGSYAESFMKENNLNYTSVYSQSQLAEIARQEAIRRAKQERIAEERRREEFRKRQEEEERKRLEAEERAKRVARYSELLEEEKILLQTIEENKGIFGEKAKKRKAAKQRLEEVRTELEKYKDLY